MAAPVPVPSGRQLLPHEPQEPPSLTAGIPSPDAIEQQRFAYAKGLDDQLRQGTDVLAQQLKQQADYLREMAEKQKRQYALQVDQQIKHQEVALVQQHNEQLLLLQQAAQHQKSALEHQANALLMEYSHRKAQEDLLRQQYEFQKYHYEATLRHAEEMRTLKTNQQAAAQQVAAQQAAIMQQAAHASQQAHVATVSALQRSASGFLSSGSYSASPRSPTPTSSLTFGAPLPIQSFSQPHSMAVLQAAQQRELQGIVNTRASLPTGPVPALPGFPAPTTSMTNGVTVTVAPPLSARGRPH